MTLQRVCAESDLSVGEKKTFGAGDKTILLYRLEDGFFATQRFCPHMSAPLERGKIMDGRIIQCPLHHSRFDIRTGKVVRWANFPPGIQLLNVVRGEKALRIYSVVIEEGMVFVDV